MPKLIDLTGKKFGKLIVIKREKNKNHNTQWLCLCECGNYKVIQGGNLKIGQKSCGCIPGNYKHGQAASGPKTHTYNIWVGMVQRCRDPKHNEYEHYGGRGIYVYEPWLTFENFFNELGECPKGMTIDRINNNGNYEPGNVRWATYKEQTRNKSNNRLITIDGKTKCLEDWILESNINYRTIKSRIYKQNWSIEDAIKMPAIDKNPKLFTINNIIKNISEWARYYNLSITKVSNRLQLGWSIEEALGLKKRDNNLYIIVDGKKDKLHNFCRIYNKKYNIIYYRIYTLNWTPEEALELVPCKKSKGKK